MGKIITIKQAIEISKDLKRKNKIAVLVGGAFDLLHVGHVKFLEEAKKQGDFLFVLLESDKSIRKLKGNLRPLNSQKDRALILSSINYVDFVIKLKGILQNKEYDKIIQKLLPRVLATTAKDLNIEHKKRQAKLTGAKVIEVIKRIPNKSTSKIIDSLK